MAYTWITTTQAAADLADRLQDPGQVQWTASALQLWLAEACRTWNALTSQYRSSVTFNLGSGNWYDLTGGGNSNVINIAESPRPYTVSDANLLQTIETHLLEPDGGYATWTGSLQFNLADVYAAIQRARDEVLSLTGCTVTRVVLAQSGGSASSVVTLPDNVIDIRRVFFPAPSGMSSAVLRPADVMSKQFYDHGYGTPGVPRTYRRSAEAPLTFEVDRIPQIAGRYGYECLVVQAGAPLGTGTVQLLGVPDDWAWVVKWGALAQLFGREGNAKDAPRAEYCQFRYNQGIGLMMDSPVVLAAYVGGVPIGVDGVRNGDDFNPSWQIGGAGPARGCYLSGMNLVGFRDPGTATYTVTMQLVGNHPVSTSGFLQIGREDYMAILDYAQHLAALQMGGQDFIQTMPLFKRFLDRATLYNSKLNALGDFPVSLFDQSATESQRNPVFSSKKPSEVLA